MTNLDQFKKDFKQDMLIKVIVAMRHEAIDSQEASYLAQFILEIFKEEKAMEIFKRINKLAEKHPEILDILIKRGTEYDEKQRVEEISQIQVYFKANMNRGEAN